MRGSAAARIPWPSERSSSARPCAAWQARAMSAFCGRGSGVSGGLPATVGGSAVVAGIRGILEGASGTPEALEWTRLCTQSAKCIPACPENVNPMLMMRLSRITSLGSTGGPAMLPDGKRDPNFFRRINAFSALQFSDAEIAEWQR